MHLQATTNLTIPADALVKAAGPHTVTQRVLDVRRGERPTKFGDFATVGPGSIVEADKIPAANLERMRFPKDPDRFPPSLIAVKEALSPDPPRTAVHAASDDSGDKVARIDTLPPPIWWRSAKTSEPKVVSRVLGLTAMNTMAVSPHRFWTVPPSTTDASPTVIEPGCRPR